MGNSIQRPVARFEDFEVNLETGEVWKAGRPLKVQDQPFRVLAALLKRPGEIVTRDELRQLIWPDKTFGDFDHAMPAGRRTAATFPIMVMKNFR
jgi:DNA-binding winged helix-turn-helix (wHTH) protein